ncbi:transcriptional regulator GlxA family with amidase domain [Haloactinopolyspora alba]|uniref:Transcriptional regulator GlxA family with amidase domain n=1 Tax=Haloactinopolyspora alba TaxID=648780 RepID=A0A2P8EB36_9ACTN|nr:helix-turn-helix domain-containing protein [Haloactinopolyspora alba]PSL06657.1 transcriptional regulator GlxA family with amidase domain [Haloactinopolyspora alba]
MMRNVAVVVLDGVAAFELGVLCEAFGLDRSDQGLPNFAFDLCGLRPGPVSTKSGFDISVRHGLDRLDEADLVGVPAMPRGDTFPDELLDALNAAVDRGARVLSVCSGAFVLGAAGLLDGRRCTTHWMYSDELALRYPRAKVDPGVLYVDDDPIITSAGTAAGIDASLHLWRKEFGADSAAAVARRMVVPPHRDGGQAQFIDTPIRASDVPTLSGVLEYMSAHLDEDLGVERLAAVASMSSRTFARRFRDETGTTPYEWVLSARLSAAQRMLERGDDVLEAVAARAGFGTAAVMRHHFARRLGTTPRAYRAAFRAQMPVVDRG